MRPLFVLLPHLLYCAPVPLFHGQSLAGWVHEGPRATFAAIDGSLHTSGEGNSPNWLRTDREYENFRLTFDYKLAQWAETAIVLRAPRAERPARSGITVVLTHDFHQILTDYVTGAVAGAAPPRELLPPLYGVWHKAAIELEGDRLDVAIDGRVLQSVDMSGHPELKRKLKRGYIGFLDLGHECWFRNIAIDERPGTAKYVELWDGRAIDGWKLRGGGEWRVAEGAIRGASGHGVLYAPGAFSDFEFTALVRSHRRVNSGIFLRGSPDESKPRGFEVQIYSPPEAVYPTGSIYSKVRSRTRVDFEERWFLIQVRVEGRRCEVRLDGDLVAEGEVTGEPAGQIGLQIHMDNASVEFRDLRVYPIERRL